MIECNHDFSVDDEFQHYVTDTKFWFKMRCDVCGKLYKVFAEIDWIKSEELEEDLNEDSTTL